MRKQTLVCFLLLIFGAVVTAFTLMIPQIGFLEWFSLIPVVYAANQICGRKLCLRRMAWWSGFLTGFSFYFVLFHWLVKLYPMDYVDLDPASAILVIALGWIGIPAIYGLVSGCLFLLYRRIYQTGLFRRVPLLRPFVFAALWTVFEWATTQTWLGVPWGRLALGQIDMRPMLWISSVFGGFAVTFLMVAVNALLAEAIANPKKTVVSGILAAALFAGNLGCGMIWLNREPKSEASVKVAVLQGNIGVYEKWTDNIDLDLQTYASLTRQAAEEGAELILWPETALPYVPDSGRWNFLTAFSRELNVNLIIGALYHDQAGNEYNALFYVDREKGLSDTIYCKRHLVPFGEYVPMKELIQTVIPPLAKVSEVNYLRAGTSSALFASEWGEIGSLICFDSIYDSLSNQSVRDGAQLMVLASNDSWCFGSVAVNQHLAQAKLRAIETGKWMVRAANTGISAVISPLGEIEEELAKDTKGYLIQTVDFIPQKTVYSRIGNLFVYCCIAFVAGSWISGLIWKRKKRRKSVGG